MARLTLLDSYVKGHILDLRLIHHTDGPLKRFAEIMQTRGTQQFKVVPSLSELQQTLDKFGHAILAFEAPLVQSIKLARNNDSQSNLLTPVQNFEPVQGKSSNACEFKLVMAT